MQQARLTSEDHVVFPRAIHLMQTQHWKTPLMAVIAFGVVHHLGTV